MFAVLMPWVFLAVVLREVEKKPNTVAGLMTSHRRNMVQGVDTAFGSLVVGVKIQS